MFNLFDCTVGCRTLGAKPRNATTEERNAYLRWLAQRDGIAVPAGATFGDSGIMLAGELIVAMPGYGDTRRAMLEVLDDDGAVIRSTPIAVDARGNMTMTKAQVQEATGLKPVRQPKRRASIAVAEIKPAEILPSEAPQSAAPDPAPSHPEIAPIAAERQPSALPDASAAMTARLDTLERKVAALYRLATPTVGKAARSAAHERAVRRAWAERARRRQVATELSIARQDVATAYRDAERFAGMGNRYRDQRRRVVVNARSALSRSRQAARFQSQRADVLHAQLVALRAAMADPSQPERASDINRLMSERDQARNACAALEQRCSGMQTALEQVAVAVEEWSRRAMRAEAELRATRPIAA